MAFIIFIDNSWYERNTVFYADNLFKLFYILNTENSKNNYNLDLVFFIWNNSCYDMKYFIHHFVKIHMAYLLKVIA